jgi:hypothetical protein
MRTTRVHTSHMAAAPEPLRHGRTERRAQLAFVLLLAAVSICAASLPASAASPPPAVRFAILGDRCGGHQPGVYEEIVAEIERLRPDFVVTVGDQVEGYSEDSLAIAGMWQEYHAIVSPLTMPLYLTPGNHDILSDIGERFFRREAGAPYRSFDVGDLHFVVLDTGRWERSADLPKAQIDWLTQDLESHRAARHTFVFFHKPFWFDTLVDGLRDPLHDIFVRYGVDAVFCGHDHFYFSGLYDGIRYTAVGSSGGAADPSLNGTLYQFTWVTVDADGIHIAPIAKDAVYDWETVTASEARLATTIQARGLDCTPSAPVDAQLHVASTRIAVGIDNSLATADLSDTLRWEVPVGWTVTPPSAPVHLGAGRMISFPFEVSCTGALYPAPFARLAFRYSPERSVIAQAWLRVAREATAHVTNGPVTIDGRLDERCWQTPETRTFDAVGNAASAEPVAFYFAYDAENLYLGARCEESRMDSLVAAVYERDGAIFGEDCIGYFLAPHGGNDTVYQIYFNELGTVFDQRIVRDADGQMVPDRAWNGTYEVGVQRGERDWSIEMRVPLAQLEVSAKAGDLWRINFRRKQPHRNGVADWQVPISSDPRDFGVLKLAP